MDTRSKPWPGMPHVYPQTLLHCHPTRLLQTEAELRNAQSEFDRQVEITKLLLEGISSSHVSSNQIAMSHLSSYLVAMNVSSVCTIFEWC